MINRIWCLKQDTLQVRGMVKLDFICVGFAELQGTESKRKNTNDKNMSSAGFEPATFRTALKADPAPLTTLLRWLDIYVKEPYLSMTRVSDYN